MLRFAAVVFALLAATPAFARPDARTMTCASLNALIAREGAVVVTTGDFTFERFVASFQFCDSQTMLKSAYQATADDRRCVVNSVCGDRAYDFGDMFD